MGRINGPVVIVTVTENRSRRSLPVRGIWNTRYIKFLLSRLSVTLADNLELVASTIGLTLKNRLRNLRH